MTKRILLFIVGLIILSVVYHSLVVPVSTLARQSAAVAATARSNTAYVVQQSMESGVSFPWFTVGVLILFAVCFTTPIVKAFKSLP